MARAVTCPGSPRHDRVQRPRQKVHRDASCCDGPAFTMAAFTPRSLALAHARTGEFPPDDTRDTPPRRPR